MEFNNKLTKVIKKNDSLLCIGLDIDKDKIPAYLFKKEKTPYLNFNKKIIDTTKDLVCGYKLNLAFYEVLGLRGYKILQQTIEYIPDNLLVILDGKRNDIGNTAKKYAESIFETLGADATTVNPYLGFDGIKPFIDYKEKCSFILCRTSNPSAKDFQDLKTNNKKLYEKVAENIKKWNLYNNCGAVIGATYPEEMKDIRNIIGYEIPLLIPGIGKQGGDLKKTVIYGSGKNSSKAIIVSARSIIFAGSNKNFATKSREKAQELKNQINKYR